MSKSLSSETLAIRSTLPEKPSPIDLKGQYVRLQRRLFLKEMPNLFLKCPMEVLFS